MPEFVRAYLFKHCPINLKPIGRWLDVCRTPKCETYYVFTFSGATDVVYLPLWGSFVDHIFLKTQYLATSVLGLHCLPKPNKKDAWVIWVNYLYFQLFLCL